MLAEWTGAQAGARAPLASAWPAFAGLLWQVFARIPFVACGLRRRRSPILDVSFSCRAAATSDCSISSMVGRDASMTTTDLSFSNPTALTLLSNAAEPAFARTVGCIPRYMQKAKIDTSESTPIRYAEQRIVGSWRLKASLVSLHKRHNAFLFQMRNAFQSRATIALPSRQRSRESWSRTISPMMPVGERAHARRPAHGGVQ